MNPNTRSIFKDGKLKPGIYKIQNLFSETYLDIHRHSREVCCRSTRDLGDGRGLVSQYLPSVVHVSDGQKWEIKSLGGGYTVRMVSLLMQSPVHCPPLYTEPYEIRSNREDQNSFVLQWKDLTAGIRSVSPLILWLGELRLPKTVYIKDLNMSGWNWILLDIQEWLTDVVY